jgi:hypothetical protein
VLSKERLPMVVYPNIVYHSYKSHNSVTPNRVAACDKT